MYLKSLTLKGFKSFASPTTLRFEPGITAVVGPNGSGKSNVVDALAWVMGEQGAKTLRGGKMEDVIFAGTSSRAPLGRAEVTVTIDNSDSALPIEYSEVSITRRMFRDGASEYEINGSSCRLMDVQELLSDSGIGREMHVIVGQGKLDEILQSRPEDRRAFIEEAAGVLKHRKRKEKALRKLDAMSANLARLTDLTTELRRQLKPLGRQAEVARRAQTIQADLRDARLRLAADDLVNRQVERDAILRGRDRHAPRARRGRRPPGGGVRGADRPRDRAGRAVGPRRVGPAHLVRGCPRWPNASVRRCASPANAPSTSTSSRWPPATPIRMRWTPRPSRWRSPSGGCLPSWPTHAPGWMPPAPSWPNASAKPPRPTEPTWRRSGRRRTGARGWRAWPARWRRCVRASSRSTTASRASPNGSNRPPPARSRPRAEFETVQGRVGELDQGEMGLDEHHERTVAALRLADARVAELQSAERDAERQVASLRARIDALSVGLERKDGAAWLTQHLSGAGLFGPIAKLVKVRSGYETALAAVLGSAADALAAENFGAAQSAVAALKAADGGPRGPRPGRLARVRIPTPHDALPGGALWALDLIDAPARLRGAMTAMLSGVAVVDDLRAALDLVGARPRLRAVTLDGDLVGAGWVSGGSDRKLSTLEVTSEIDKAGGELAAAEAQVAQLSAALSGALTEQAARQDSAEQALAALNESDTAISAMYEQLGRLGQEARAAEGGVDRVAAPARGAGSGARADGRGSHRTRNPAAQRAGDPARPRRRTRLCGGPPADRRRRRDRPWRRSGGAAGGADRGGTRERGARTGGFAAPRCCGRTRSTVAGPAGARGAAARGRRRRRGGRRRTTAGAAAGPRRPRGVGTSATPWSPNARRVRRRWRRCATRSTR